MTNESKVIPWTKKLYLIKNGLEIYWRDYYNGCEDEYEGYQPWQESYLKKYFDEFAAIIAAHVPAENALPPPLSLNWAKSIYSQLVISTDRMQRDIEAAEKEKP